MIVIFSMEVHNSINERSDFNNKTGELTTWRILFSVSYTVQSCMIPSTNREWQQRKEIVRGYTLKYLSLALTHRKKRKGVSMT